MNYNIAAYLIYLLLLTPTVIVVGRSCHKNGELYILNLAESQNNLGFTINNLLLIGYYLVNIGFTIYIISFWDYINSPLKLLESICSNTGLIITILGGLHYINIIGVTLFFKNNNL